jgi:hypothetical protein
MNATSRSSSCVGILLVAGALALASGCAAAKQAPSAEPSAPQGYGQGAYPAGAAPQSQPGYAPAPPPPPSPEAAPATPSTAAKPRQPNGGGTAPTDRSLALRAASSEIEASQRELDISGGDCRNACRALGSMDRAAGRLCELAQGADEGSRCGDAKQRVYSARDRVRTSCGSCPNGPSVDRAAPIPSLR